MNLWWCNCHSFMKSHRVQHLIIGFCLLTFTFNFNFQSPSNPIVFFFIIFYISLPPPPSHTHTLLFHQNISNIIKDILKLLLHQELQPNGAIFWLNEILARFLKKKCWSMRIKNKAFNRSAPLIWFQYHKGSDLGFQDFWSQNPGTWILCNWTPTSHCFQYM